MLVAAGGDVVRVASYQDGQSPDPDPRRLEDDDRSSLEIVFDRFEIRQQKRYLICRSPLRSSTKQHYRGLRGRTLIQDRREVGVGGDHRPILRCGAIEDGGIIRGGKSKIANVDGIVPSFS